MRRYGWQIGGVGIAVALVAALALMAHASSGHASVPRERTVATPRATPTVDVRVAEVEAAAKRYVEALQTAAKTGDPHDVDALVVPGSPAEGNAGIASSFSRDNHYAFITTSVDYKSWQVSLDLSAATLTVQYALYGHTADWPSLRPRETDRTTDPVTLHLELELHGSTWLVSQSS